MRGLRLRFSPSRSHTPQKLDLRPVEELNDETRSLPDAEHLFSEVDDEYRRMEADHTAGLVPD